MGFASSKWTPDTTCPVQSVTRRLMDSRIMWEERSPGDPLATNAGVTLPTVPNRNTSGCRCPPREMGRNEERLRRGLCESGRACRYQRWKKWHGWTLVFSQNGKSLQGRDVTQCDLKRSCQQAKVPPIRFQDLRHLHNTILMRGNVNAGIIKSRARHSSVALSLDRNAWALDHAVQQVTVDALEQSMTPRPTLAT